MGKTNPQARLWGMALAMGLVAACSSPPPEPQVASEPAVAVQTATLRSADRAEVFEAGGVVQARATAAVAARLVAPVLDIRVAPGDRVSEGEILVVLDGRDLAAQVRAAAATRAAAEDGAAAARAEEQSAQAALILAQASYQRIAALHAKQSATAQEFDQATAAVRSAESHVLAAAARVKAAAAGVERAGASHEAAVATESFLRLTAPFAGLVTEKMVERGNMATPGQPLLRVEDTSGFRVDVRVDESRAARLTPGMQVKVALDDDPARSRLPGTVTELSRSVSADERASLVKIDLPDAPADLRSGAFARVRFPGPTHRALIVPVEAIVTQGQVTSVFVVEDDIARLRLVRLHDDEVLAGLVEGDVVIVSPPSGLADGRAVSTGGSR